MRIYVGNLSYDISEEELRQEFLAFGEVESVNVILDRYSGRPKGFGFVEMPSSSEAQAAIEGLNETVHDGRPLTVNEAKPRENRGGRGGYGGGRGDRGGRY